MKSAKVYLDGKLIGFCDNGPTFVDKFRKLRKAGKIESQVNVGYRDDTNEIYINTSGGRIQRPLIVLKDGVPLVTEKHVKDVKDGKLRFSDLVHMGLIEYLDADEEDNAYIATDPRKIKPEHTHIELDPIVLFSLVTSMVPFLEHDLATKTLHGAKMFKQATGYYAANHALKTDTESFMLYYPQKHMVTTGTIDMIGAEDRPIIQNFVVAIMPYYGFNMYDAVVLNKGAVDRGLGRISYYRTYSDRESLYPGGQRDYFKTLDEDSDDYPGEEAYRIIGDDNYPELESYVDKDSILIAKISPPRYVEDISEFGLIEEKFEDSSSYIKKNMEGYVDKVYLSDNGETKILKVKTRSLRVPENGDKFSSKHGQKGVVGLVVPEIDMPISTNGVMPDLILNPHSIPSRMTIGDLLELLTGKAASFVGEPLDGTPYSSVDVEDVKKVLREYGLRPDGYEVFYDGVSGKPIVGEIYSGVIAYRRLYHLVHHKVQARARGPVQVLTRQPTEGKEKEGGLKFGEMESDCLVGYGAAMLLNEKLVEDSDKIKLPVCRECGTIAVDDKMQGKRYCVACANSEIVSVTMPYSFKLLLDELKAMVIIPKILLDDAI